MATIKRIDMVAFADHTDVAVTDRGVFTVKKTRGTDIYGMWKATKAYEIEVGPDDMKELYKDPRFYSISTDNFIDLCKKNGLLPDNKRYFIRKSDWSTSFAVRDRGFRNLEGEGPYYQPTTKLVVFSIDDFVKCPQTKKELQILEKVNNRKAIQKLNMLVVKDNLLKILNDKGYDCICYDAEMSTIEYKSKKGYNALVKDALEYYLNNIVLKELGCKLTIPKVAANHAYGQGDPLCYIGDIKITEGE